MAKREIIKIVVQGFEANESDDDIIQKMFLTELVGFNDLRSTFNEIIKEKGLRLTNKERKIKTNELLEGVTRFENSEEMLKCVAMLQDELKVATTKAMGSLRTWAKDNGVELPKAPRVTKARKIGFGGHYAKLLAHSIDLRNSGSDIDKTSMVAFCHANNIPESYSTITLNMVHFAKQWNGEITEEAEEVAEAA
ncbi:MAG: hypothetical protein J7M01_02725 [Candidatus Marinimicrobia bacterium]|nr:hypothetical protein [Candidatus Neomarinimicrobiota bacterium]